MKKSYLAAVALLLAGCAQTSTLQWTAPVPGQQSRSGAPVLWNLTAVNNGMYLFYFIPVWCGYNTRPNRHDYELGKHLLTEPEMRRMLDCHLQELKADRVEDVEFTESSSGALGLWIIWKRSMRATGVAVKAAK
ncbi:MAG: hypothetical protein MR051_01530 [Lentisphaeria bacterium]|nr:hypothetical protein [Lentisphaeria bacterium]